MKIDPKNESPRDKFVRLAETRTEKAVNAIDNISSLANPKSYEYTEKDISQIIKALKDSVDNVDKAFKIKEEKKEFKLK